MEKKEFETSKINIREINEDVICASKPGAGTGSPGEDAFDRTCIDFTIG